MHFKVGNEKQELTIEFVVCFEKVDTELNGIFGKAVMV